ncbi:hypothetical protein BV20DRAFT_365389 [Pilatotrama ljubarskyi]|nr:hypothetical protein BV20DRAFT_365389 [Pilatotrama ljubarskyi]
MIYDQSNSRLVIIEDRDEAVQYEGDWVPTTIFGETLSMARGIDASVSFEFDGTRIIVIALAIPVDYEYASVSVIQFAIDSVVAETVVAPVYTNYTFYRVFESQGLGEGTHTINMTVLDAPYDYPFYLDYFMFQPSKKYGNLAFAPSTLQVQSGGPMGSSSDKPQVGAIVGGVLGGLTFVGLAIGLFFWWRRRRQHAYASLDGSYDPVVKPKSPPSITPFTSIRPTSAAFTADSKRASSNPSGAPRATSFFVPASTSAPSASSGDSSTSPQSPSEHSSTGATVASSSTIPADSQIGAVPGSLGYQVREAPHLHSMHGRVGSTHAVVTPLSLRKQRRPGMADLVQAAVQAARGTTRRDDVTPSEAPPRYSAH